MIKSAFYSLQVALSSLIWPYFTLKERFFPPNEARILVYHSVSDFPPEKDVPYDNVLPALFERHMSILFNQHFNIVSLSELSKQMHKGCSMQPRTIVVTFDDGYKNNRLNVLPVLKKLNLKATFFLITGAIGANEPFKHLLWDDMARQYWAKYPNSRLPMNWDDAEALLDQGMEIGSHTMTHRSVGNLLPKEAFEELAKSKEMLETQFGNQVRSFSYPFGSRWYDDFNAETGDLLKSVGYDCACTSEIGSVKQKDNVYELRRIPIRENDNLFRFKQKLIGAYDWVNAAKATFQKHANRVDKVL